MRWHHDRKKNSLWCISAEDQESECLSVIFSTGLPVQMQAAERHGARRVDIHGPFAGSLIKAGSRSHYGNHGGKSQPLSNEASFLDRIRQARPTDAVLIRKGLRKRLIERDGLWWKATEGEHMALYIPQDEGSALRQDCIEWVHVHPFSGHVGGDRTTELLQRDFRWPLALAGLQDDIAKYVQDCEMCRTDKSLNRKKARLLSPLPVPGRPWESIGDFITHLPGTKAGYTALYVVVDRLTNLVHMTPTTDTAAAADTTQLFLDMVFQNQAI